MRHNLLAAMAKAVALPALALVTLALPLAVTAPAAKAEEVVRIGMPPEPYPPFSVKDANGTWSGFEIDLLNDVCAKMKAKCEIVEVAWDGIIPALQEKKIDVIWASMSITEERAKVIDFSNKYYDNRAWLIGPKSEEIKIDFEHPESLSGKVIGVQTSTNHANFVQKYFGKTADIKLYDKQDNANADLVAGRLDLVMAGAITLNDFLKSPQGKDFELKAVAPRDPVLGKGIGAGLRKSDTKLREEIDAAIAGIRADGSYDKVAKKYFDFDIYGG